MDLRRIARKLPFATLASCVALCLSALSGPQASLRTASPGLPGPPESVTLEELEAAPGSWLGRAVRFTFQLHSAPASWNPYLTRFGTSDYAAALAWGDEQLLWEAEEFENPQAMLFARRGSDPAAILAQAPVYGRYEAEGRVVQVFLGHPWIEVGRLERLPEEIGEGAILHASRALELMQAGRWNLALEDLRRAEASNLPPRARQALARMRAHCEALREARTLPLGR